MQRRPAPNTRVEMLCGQLRALAHTRGPDAKLPTVREIVRTYGTSQSTINEALATLEAQNVVYRRRGSGVYVSPAFFRKNVSVIFDPSFFAMPEMSPFWQLLWGQLFREAQQRTLSAGQTFNFHMALPDEQGGMRCPEPLPSLLASGQVHAVLQIGLQQPAEKWLTSQGVPVISFGSSGHWSVGLDGETQIRLGVEALVAQGCRRLGFWDVATQFRPGSNISLNAAIFERVLAEHGLPFDPALVKTNLHLLHPFDGLYVQTEESNQAQGYRTAMEVFGDADAARPDGIVISDDMMTSGALAALSALGVRPAVDVCIASHANIGSPALFGYTDRLTLIEVDPAQIVRALFGLLDTILAGKTPLENPVIVKPSLRQQSA